VRVGFSRIALRARKGRIFFGFRQLFGIRTFRGGCDGWCGVGVGVWRVRCVWVFLGLLGRAWEAGLGVAAFAGFGVGCDLVWCQDFDGVCDLLSFGW
jgi:hypothetical protein